jgi:hypothetical protein
MLKTLAKHRMDFTAAARELEVKTIDLYRFASRLMCIIFRSAGTASWKSQ